MAIHCLRLELDLGRDLELDLGRDLPQEIPEEGLYNYHQSQDVKIYRMSKMTLKNHQH